MKTITRKLIALLLVVSGIIFSNSALAACNVPTGLNTTAITSTTAVLNWTAPSGGAQSYNVRYRVVSTSIWTTATSTTVSKNISSLTASTAYEWQVQSKCSGTQTSSWTSSSTFTTLVLCNTPTGLNTTSITSTGATLNWTAVSGASNYNVQYRVVGAPSWISTTSTTTSKAITSLTSSSNYEWQVQTNCGSSNLSVFSSSATFATQAPPCNIPAGLNTTGITSTGATLNWSAASGAVSYNLQYRVIGAPSWTATTSSTTSKTLTSLSVSSNYEWQVQTNCGSSNLSAFSSSSTFATPVPPCNTPTGLSISGITPTGATLNWNSVSGAVGYNVEYRGVGELSWASATTTSTSLTVTTLTATTNYEWQVQTNCDNSNLSAFSSTSTFTTHAAPCGVPAGLNTTAVTLSDAALNWTSVSGATDYKIQYRELGVSSWTQTTSQATSVTVTGLNGHANYEWQVQAYCSNNVASAFSSSAYFTADPNVIPMSTFYGTWTGVDQNGNAVEVTFTQNGGSTFHINGSPDSPANPVVAFRLPQYRIQTATFSTPSDANSTGEEAVSTASARERTIKFYTDNAIHGRSGHPLVSNAPVSSPNTLTNNTLPQIYTATAVITLNTFGSYEMSLFVDLSQFSAQPPAVDFSQNPMGNIPPYAILIKQ